MRFEDLRRGHWFIIALLAGAGIAALQDMTSGSNNFAQTHSQVELETRLTRPPLKSSDGIEYPWIRNITIYPPASSGFAVTQGTSQVVPRKSAITYQILSPVNKSKGWEYRDAVSLVDDPFRPGRRRAEDPTLTISSYIAAAAKNRPWINYSYAWWLEARYLYPLWIGSAVLLLGIIWPTIQNRLINAGYGARSAETPEKPEKGSSLWHRLFARKNRQVLSGDLSSASSKPAPASALSEEDLARIAAMEANLQNYTPSDDREIGGETAEPVAPPPGIRTLNSEPLETAPPPEKPHEDQDYDGEFYPTVAHAKKKTSESQ